MSLLFFFSFWSSFCSSLELLFVLHLVCAREMEEVTQATYESWEEHRQIINNFYKLLLSNELTLSQPCVCQYAK